MEAVMDWWMVYRDDADLRALSGGRASEMRTRMLVGGRVSCLELKAAS
jgi:hypothetical protein